MNPKVSIIIATFNRAPFIGDMLASVKNQTYGNWECLIIDDGCTDHTFQVIEPYLESDTRFNYHLRNDSYSKGTSGCRNYGLDLSNGDYIIFFDDDDISHPLNLELCVEQLLRKDISFCRYLREAFFGDFDYNFDLSKDFDHFYIGLNDIERVLKYELTFNSCAIMWKKECFEFAHFNEKISFADEWELYTRILSMGFKGISIDKCLFYGRKHSDSITGAYFRNDSVRKQSYYQAILLVVENLKDKQMVSDSLIRYFIQLSLEFKSFNLFEEILDILEFSKLKKLKWRVFYKTLPIRLWLYKIKKSIK